MSSEIPFTYLLCQAWVWHKAKLHTYIYGNGEIRGEGEHFYDASKVWYGIGYLYELTNGVSGYADPSPYEHHIGHYVCVTINSEV